MPKTTRHSVLFQNGSFKWMTLVFCVVFAFFLADFLMGEPRVAVHDAGPVPFNHALHGDSIGMDCTACHTGANARAEAFMPSKADCMDCHRLPLTEKPGIETLDSVLSNADERPWSHKRFLPEHVVFHHGVHHVAGVACSDCHGQGYMNNRYGGEKFDMQTCLKCHRGELFKEKGFKPAATYCAACHR